jgi:hypothetical protein
MGYSRERRNTAMPRMLPLFVLVVLALSSAVPLSADPSATSVGLGFSFGAAFPQGSTTNIPNTEGQPSFNWGFYVNIPLISTFHITPSTELYKFDAQNATDVDLAFKFIVALDDISLFAGVSPGVTTVADVLAPHVGVLLGAGFPLVSNLDAFIQAKYNILFDANQNIRIFHVSAGVLFAF